MMLELRLSQQRRKKATKEKNKAGQRARVASHFQLHKTESLKGMKI